MRTHRTLQSLLASTAGPKMPEKSIVGTGVAKNGNAHHAAVAFRTDVDQADFRNPFL